MKRWTETKNLSWQKRTKIDAQIIFEATFWVCFHLVNRPEVAPSKMEVVPRNFHSSSGKLATDE